MKQLSTAPVRRSSQGWLLLVIVVLLWGATLSDYFRRPLSDVSDSVLEGRGTWPFHLVGIVLCGQATLCAVAGMCLWGFVYLRDAGNGEIQFLSRFLGVAGVLGVDAFLAGVHYLQMASTPEQCVGRAGLYEGADEPRLLLRYVLWALLAPTQWVVFALLYTQASASEICKLMLMVSATMLFGYCSAAADSHAATGGVNVLSLIWLIASCLMCAVMFRQVMLLREDNTLQAARPRLVKYLAYLWALYPVVLVCRSVGLISAWTEQVLLISFLDCVEKTVLGVFCLSGRTYPLLASSLSNLQAVNARQRLAE
eukprot:gb/GFBE01022919.1/.p1 GENE.gb/GFBE01022919.1/~~gb/GFBE01022919.1/.p1  ORF type:complete len:311 (+),score=33.87 gb/GFBE01022919.1/:1-933(+)